MIMIVFFTYLYVEVEFVILLLIVAILALVAQNTNTISNSEVLNLIKATIFCIPHNLDTLLNTMYSMVIYKLWHTLVCWIT